MSIEKLKEALRGLPRTSRGRIMRVPDSLKAEILQRRAEYKGRRHSFAQEIAISPVTISGWIKEIVPQPAAGRFRRVKITDQSEAAPTPNRFTLECPLGMRLGNLSIAEIAELLKAVSQNEF